MIHDSDIGRIPKELMCEFCAVVAVGGRGKRSATPRRRRIEPGGRNSRQEPVLSPTGEIGRQKRRIERSEIGATKAEAY